MANEQRNSVTSMLKPKKAAWTLEIHKVFVDVCLEQTLKGNKPGTHFTKEGWRNIEESFKKKSGLRYERKQLKNHWDSTKEQWKCWCKLIDTDRMKWDPINRKFGASEEDWANYLQANAGAAQFRFKELPFTDKLETIFDGRIVSGETEPPPQRRRLSDDSTTSLLHTKEPGPGDSTTSLLHTKEPGPGVSRPDIRTERVCEAAESRSVVTVQSSLGKLNYSIGECIECLDGLEEVEPGSDLYLFALDIFLKKEYREIFLQLKKPSVRVAWLQRLQSVGPPLPLR
ncbi:L10-interacting MYB domain-containing protein [Cornus florida]|uniref:L10-interacting MYB domain-containing protein n=1 Tax=Cornus florida TaxID=4283 RepID=UPI0028A04BED|nr:L10-interacting MYB domain-containing protein [Cornus florida]